jgi:hypothetical protein
MTKIHPIIKGMTATLLVVFGLIMIVWATGRPTSLTAQTGRDSIKTVRLKITFPDGHWANVTEVEGGTITIERDGTKLAITPHIRDQRSGKVELQVTESGNRETALDTLLVDQSLTKVTRGNLPFSVQLLDAGRILPGDLAIAVAANQCCARTCSGILICGVCVCTDCGVCATKPWCDCHS